MIGYICKYAPVEIFESMGAEPVRIQPTVSDFNTADMLMHPNMCSFIKSVLEDVMKGDYEGIILTTCCDSTRRLYDVLTEQMPERFIYLLDVPRKVNDFSTGMFKNNIIKMTRAYESFSGRKFSTEEFAKTLTLHAAAQDLRKAPDSGDGLKIGLVGTRCSSGILNLLSDRHAKVLFDMTCTGLERHFRAPEEKSSDLSGREYLQGDSSRAGQAKTFFENLIWDYAWDLLNQVPCLRMVRASGRERFIDGYLDRLDGIICHTVKFCDMYSFEYASIRENLDVPVLQVETDSTRQNEGQIRTRVEAFLESLGRARRSDSGGKSVSSGSTGSTGIEGNTGDEGLKTLAGSAEKTGSDASNYGEHGKGAGLRGDRKMTYVLGVDSGSTSTNAVILDGSRKIVAYDIIRTGAKSGDSAQRVLERVLRKAHLRREDIESIVSTGYGRVSIPYADENVTEISCHGRGAHYFNPAVRTVLDIGGQDSKAMHLNDKGEVTDFVMNDKCAAGTGRFLEMMARTLELDVSELGPVSLKWKENIEITSMCSVFAESEVISLIARNKEKPDIAHGIHNAIAGKAFSLLRRVGLDEVFMMTGGVAKNPGVVKAVEEKIGARLYICSEPEIVGALGAALFALEKI